MSIILSDVDDVNEIISEEKEKWIWSILSNLGFKCNENDDPFILREKLLNHGIEIQNFATGEIDIMLNNKLISHWSRPVLKYRKDECGKKYCEIYLNI